jgi:MSHA pilin protein MshD
MYMTRRSSSARQRGFTLIELIIFIVVVAAGLAGILSVMNTVVKSSADPMIRKQTVAIAESMLEEILLKEYCDPDTMISLISRTCGAASREATRNLYDDVDDYDGYTTTGGIVDAFSTTTPLPVVGGLENYNISSVAVDGTATLGTLAVKKVTVTVTGPQGPITLVGYRSNY